MAASIWKGRISFGLVSIPVRLVKAARRERTRFRRVQRARAANSTMESEEEATTPPSRVLAFPGAGRNAPPPPVDEDEEDVAVDEQPVVRVHNQPTAAPSEILKGFEVSKDAFVVLSPDEVAALRPQTSSALEISEFVKLDEIDPLYYETSYYVVPDAGGEKAYSLLFTTLKETRHAGMGSLAMHGREHVALIRAGHDSLVLHSMFYANEIGRPAFQVESAPSNPKELELAKLLVGVLEAPFDPEKWKDSYEEKLKALIESRTPVSSEGLTPEAKPAATTVDIMEALRKSLEMNRKPVGREETPAPAAKPKRQGARRK